MDALTRFILSRLNPISCDDRVRLTCLSTLASGRLIPVSLEFCSIEQSRLDFAKTLVPSVNTVLVERGVSPKEIAVQIKAAAGLDLAIALECTGVESSIWTAIYSVKVGRRALLCLAINDRS